MLGNRHCDTHDVRFLEGIGSDCERVHLTGDCKHRNRVHVSISNCCDQVCSTRSAGCDANAELAASSRVTLGSVTSTLLVTNQDVSHLG